jgi:hypothetical protein
MFRYDTTHDVSELLKPIPVTDTVTPAEADFGVTCIAGPATILISPVALSDAKPLLPVAVMFWLVPAPPVNVNCPLVNSPALMEHDGAVAIEANELGYDE